MIETKELARKFGELTAVERLTIRVDEGELLLRRVKRKSRVMS